MIQIKDAAITIVSTQGQVGYIVNEQQIMNIIDSALRERSIIADMKIVQDLNKSTNGGYK